MRNGLWKLKLGRLKVSSFAFALCLWVDEFRQGQATTSDASPASATEDAFEEIAEAQEDLGPAGNSSRPWVPKCCDLNYGFTFENKSHCVQTEDEFLPDFEDWPDYSQTAKDLPVKARYEYYIGDPCPDGKYILDLTAYPDDKYSVYANGTLLYFDWLHGKEDFCLETLNGTIRAFVCFGVEKINREANFNFVFYAVGLFISVPFLLVTALIYSCIERFRDLRGKSLSCHVVCLATAYLALATVQLSSDQLDEALCIASGFIIQFFFVAAFFWLNVICYNTWRCMNDDFRCIYRPLNLRSEKVQFYYYCLYGWYGPIMLTVITLIMDLEPAIPESYLKPKFGLRSCWFYSDHAALPYFYGPVAVVIFINIVFFVLSARIIYFQQKRQEECKARSRNSTEEMREITISVRIYTKTLQECIYLFCIMGITWAAEVLSWAVGGSQEIWLTTDIFNALQGVMIFYLFVIKPENVRMEVSHRIRSTWRKIIKCDRHHEEENKRQSRHWHAKLRYDAEDLSPDDEKGKLFTETANIVITNASTTTTTTTV